MFNLIVLLVIVFIILDSMGIVKIGLGLICVYGFVAVICYLSIVLIGGLFFAMTKDDKKDNCKFK